MRLIDELPGGTATAEMAAFQAKKVGILGAGMMGAGIAYVAAKAGIEAGEGDRAFLEAKLVSTRFYLDQIVPAATGLAASALAGDAALAPIPKIA